MDKVSFIASIPTIKSAIILGGQDGGQVKFEVPESDIAGLVSLVRYREQALKVTVEPLMEVLEAE